MDLTEKSRFFRRLLRLLKPDHVSAREAVEATLKMQEKEKVPRPRKRGLEDCNDSLTGAVSIME